ncbi:hypothetical protein CERSUDRAFT_93499 [Gelatoporia subvermispora B]|uniref:CCHC-type domain-containing protein n=1 Tax=Ceriporiopsis subvermispora (strain B) TaxID=914234 RepID=M2RHL4_CERS8|nr:hypothetical protein CERSUDRAFT_93499 [Gelatoporia subvermispora B]
MSCRDEPVGGSYKLSKLPTIPPGPYPVVEGERRTIRDHHRTTVRLRDERGRYAKSGGSTPSTTDNTRPPTPVDTNPPTRDVSQPRRPDASTNTSAIDLPDDFTLGSPWSHLGLSLPPSLSHTPIDSSALSPARSLSTLPSQTTPATSPAPQELHPPAPAIAPLLAPQRITLSDAIAPTSTILMAQPHPRFDGESPDLDPETFVQDITLNTINFTDAKRIEYAGGCFPPRTTARRWFTNLPSDQKLTWEKFLAAFDAEWPPAPEETVGPAEAARMVKNRSIDVSKLGTYDTSGDTAVAYHKQWAREITHIARKYGAPDSCAIDTREQLPETLRSMIPASVATWASFKREMEKVDTATLKERVEEARRRDEETQRVSRMAEEARRHAEETRQLLMSPTSALRRSMQNISISNQAPRAPRNNANALRPPDRDPFSTDSTMHPNNIFSGMQRPQGPNRTYTERLATMQANLPKHHDDTERGRQEYQAQVAKWLTDHPGQDPNKTRPFPLTPGTAALGSRECYKCGRAGHMGRACTATSLIPEREGTWRARAGAIIRGAAPRNDVRAVHEVSIQGRDFVLVPREAFEDEIAGWQQGNEYGPAA